MTMMLERAARAARDIQVGLDENGEAVFPGPHVGLALARAVLMAVRDPNADMSRAGGKVFNQTPAPNPVFTAMIDAILNEDPAA